MVIERQDTEAKIPTVDPILHPPSSILHPQKLKPNKICKVEMKKHVAEMMVKQKITLL
jgi:hypothetical protein